MTRQPVAAITVYATDAESAIWRARAMYGWPGDRVTTAELTPGLWHVTLHREPAGIPVHAEPGSLAGRLLDLDEPETDELPDEHYTEPVGPSLAQIIAREPV